MPPPKNLILKWLLSTKSYKGSVGILCLAHVHSLYSPVWNHFQNLISGYTVVLNTLNGRCQHNKLSVGNLCTCAQTLFADVEPILRFHFILSHAHTERKLCLTETQNKRIFQQP